MPAARPLLLGEFPGNGPSSHPPGATPPPTTLDEYLEFAVAAGYAGAWPWSFSGTDDYGPLPHEPLRALRAGASGAGEPEVRRCETTRPSLSAMGWRLAKDVNRTLGGGMASIELIRRSFERRGWLDETRHALLVAVSRFTPGTNVLAYSAALGWLVHGAAGAAVALAVGSIPARSSSPHAAP